MGHLKTLVNLFLQEDGQPESLFGYTLGTIEFFLGVEASRKFNRFVHAIDDRFYSTNENLWREVLMASEDWQIEKDNNLQKIVYTGIIDE